jgi:hypothetical protein
MDGVDNVSIGKEAGTYFNTGNTNYNKKTDYSIFIGSNSRAQGNTQSNQIVIGYNAIGNGSDSVTLGNDNITKTILRGNIGIGSTGPSTKLHIYATQSGAFRLEDGTQGNGYILTSDVNGVASWTASTYALDSNVVHKTGDENIDGIKLFTGTATTKIVLDTRNGQGIFGGVGALGSGTNFYSQNQGTGVGAYFDTATTGRAVWITSGVSSSGRVLDISAGGSGDAVSIASSGSARLIVGMSGSNVNFTLNKVGEIYTAGSINIGTGTASNSRFVVSSSGGTTSFHVNEAGDSVFRGSVVIADGTQGNGYILTSDTNGVASWTASFALGVIATSSNITTDTLDINGLSQRGRCIIIDNGTYSINLTVNGATGFSSTYLKHGTASVTFVQGSGRTLVQVDGTAVLNGVAGSTATLLSYGTTDYLRINNA